MNKVIKNSWGSVIEEEVNSQMKRKIIHGEKLMIVKMRFKDGFIVPMHSHINEQITQVNKGTIRFWLDSEESDPVDVNEGEFIIIPGGVLQKALMIGEVEETGILISIDDIFKQKKERHINSYLKEKNGDS